MRLHYGQHAQLDLELSATQLLAHVGQPANEPLDDVVAAVTASLSDPLDFPPLHQSVLPEDAVAIAVDGGIPQPELVVAGVVQALQQAGVPPEQVTIVLSETAGNLSGESLPLPAQDRKRIRIERHHAQQPGGLAYLAASEAGDPIYVNRTIFDADLVIPVGCGRLRTARDRAADRVSVFPQFSDAATRVRCQAEHPSRSAGKKRRRRELEQAAWLLGAPLAVEIVPGGNDRVLGVLSGARESVERATERAVEKIWRADVPQQASLVIACLSGHSHQTWADVVQVIAATADLVSPAGGSLAVCTQLGESPGIAWQRILGGEDSVDTDAWEDEPPPADAGMAQTLLQLLNQTHVYLLCDLPESTVIDLGMAYISQADELSNLCRHHASCIVVSNAQHARPTLDRVGTS